MNQFCIRNFQTVGTPTGSYNRQHMDPSFHPNAMTNRSVISADSMSVRVQQSSNMSAAEQRFAQIQRQVSAQVELLFSRKLISRNFKKFIARGNKLLVNAAKCGLKFATSN